MSRPDPIADVWELLHTAACDYRDQSRSGRSEARLIDALMPIVEAYGDARVAGRIPQLDDIAVGKEVEHAASRCHLAVDVLPSDVGESGMTSPGASDDEIRDQLAEALRGAAHVCGWDVPCPCIDWPDEQYDATVHATTVSAGHVNEVQGIPEAFAYALLPVLAPLLADQATVKRVEALCTAAVAAAMTPNTSVTVADLRRALDGPK